MITRFLLASGFLAAVAHFAPVAERVALGITRVEDLRVEDLAPEALARPLGEFRAAGRLSHRTEATPGTLPNPGLTPGAVRTTNKGAVCNDRSTGQYRHWSRERDDRILQEYGLPTGSHPDFEVDHLIPLDLGGADEDANLWPEPRRSIEPEWNAERKDLLEWKLADMVCSGQTSRRHRKQSATIGLPPTGPTPRRNEEQEMIKVTTIIALAATVTPAAANQCGAGSNLGTFCLKAPASALSPKCENA